MKMMAIMSGDDYDDDSCGTTPPKGQNLFNNKLDGNSMELIKCEPLVVYQS